MKTAISIPNEVFEEAERLAKRLRKSRSQLYSEALREYLARHDSESATERMNRVCEATEDRVDPWVEAAGRQVLERSEW
jgi:metal-responsive CopG/Arc/MetJ family transcriptional regulator